MTFAIEANFLLGTCTATRSRAHEDPDWPPQPDRLFSALVSAWAHHGKRDDRREALEWLESLDPPRLRCSGHARRDAPQVFVPVNDADSPARMPSKPVDQVPRSLPDRRPRQPRRFPVAVPHDPRLAFVWDVDVPARHREALDELVREIVYLGHSSSLTACRLNIEGEALDHLPERAAKRWIHVGRLAELERSHERGRRPTPGVDLSPAAKTPAGPSASVYGERWVVLERGDGPGMDLVAAARVADSLRRAIMEAVDGPMPEVLSGHGADGAASLRAHLAMLALPFVGGRHADGTVHGLAIVLPRSQDAAFARAVSGAADTEAEAALDVADVLERALDAICDDGRIRLYSRGTAALEFLREARALKSLAPARWCRVDGGGARRWSTVTPVVLDRHLKTPARSKTRGDPEALQREMADIVAGACEHAGLPRPATVVPARQSALAGVPPIKPSGPPWARWHVPARYASRSVTHVTLEFDEPVVGPVLLGAARHFGLGFCAPLPERRR